MTVEALAPQHRGNDPGAAADRRDDLPSATGQNSRDGLRLQLWPRLSLELQIQRPGREELGSQLERPEHRQRRQRRGHHPLRELPAGHLHRGRGGLPDSFFSPAGQFEESITRFTSGNRRIIERRLQDGTLETYKKPGASGSWYYLDRVDDRNGNVIDLAYDATHVLTKITDTRGRDFKFGYDGYGRLTGIQDWSSGGGSQDRAWLLQYSKYSSQLSTPHLARFLQGGDIHL